MRRRGRTLAIPTNGPPSHAVGALARRVTRRAREAHAARAICGGLAAGAFTLALAVRRGSSLEEVDALLLAALVGALAFVSWRGSRRLDTDEIVRRVDDELSLEGAFLTAYESDRAGSSSRVCQLGAARLAGRLRRTEAMEAAIPHTMGFLALPLFGLAALFLAIAARDEDVRAAQEASRRSFSLSSDLTALANDSSADLTAAERDAIQKVAQAASLAASAPSDQRQDEMAEVAERLDQLAVEVAPGSRLADSLARAAAAAESIAEAGTTPSDSGAASVAAVREEVEGVVGEVPGAIPDEGAPEAGKSEAGKSEAGKPDAGKSDAGPPEAGGADAGLADGTPTGAGAAPAGLAARPSQHPSGGPGGRAVAAAGGEAGASGPPASAAPAPDRDAPSRSALDVRWWSDRDAGLVSRWAERSRAPSDD